MQLHVKLTPTQLWCDHHQSVSSRNHYIAYQTQHT